MKAEALTKATQGLQLVVSDLREALAGSNNVEGLAILNAIAQAAELHSSVEALRVAVEADQAAATARTLCKL